MPLPRLLPVYLTDHPVLDLGAAETFVVATVRLWAAPHREPWKPWPDWRGGFRAADVTADGEHAFDTLFWIVLAGGHRALDVRCPSCPRLGCDEGWLLQLVRYGQIGQPDRVEQVLQSWLPAAAARAATVHASRYARALAAGGLELPPVPQPLRPASMAAAFHHPACATVH